MESYESHSVLKTHQEMVVLEPFREADFDRLIGWIPSSDFLLQWAGPDFEYPLNREQLSEYLKGTQGDLPSKLIYKVVDSENGTAIGHIELAAIDRHNGSARVCRVLVGDPSYRGKGVGTVMMEKIVEIGFCRLGLHRIELADKCYSLLREGGVCEGRTPQRMPKGRRWVLELLYNGYLEA